MPDRCLPISWPAGLNSGRCIEEVRGYVTRWLWAYKHERPNMVIGGITPKQELALAA